MSKRRTEMNVDAQTKALLDKMKESNAPPMYTLPVHEARAMLKEFTRLMDVPKSEVFKHEEKKIPGPHGAITVRIYWPRAVDKSEPMPLLLLYHGGGFMMGDLDTHDNMARYYCRNGGVIVVSVDYRLSPEYRFPTGVEDSYAALCWTAENAEALGGDPARIAVTGDSAGGNISAVLCQLTRARSGPAVAYQVLVYPMVNVDLAADYASRQAFGGGDYFLSLEDIKWVNSHYFGDYEKQKLDLRASPILEKDLSGLPPALVITAGFDPLRDEGEHYARRLAEANVPVEYRCFESTIHGFMSFAGVLDAGKQGLELVATRLREVLQRR
jgi:acetyl esterase